MHDHRCVRGGWQIQGSLLFVYGTNAQIGAYRIVETPTWLKDFFNEVLGQAGLMCSPQLVILENARGVLGFHSTGLVAIGQQDVLDAADAIFNMKVAPISLTPQERFRLLLDGVQIPTVEEVHREIVRAVFRIVVMHEVGHAVDQEEGRVRVGIAAERFADSVAGTLAVRLGTNVRWEREALLLGGCNETGCDHPASVIRVLDYDAARRAEVVAQVKKLLRMLLPPPQPVYSRGSHFGTSGGVFGC